MQYLKCALGARPGTIKLCYHVAQTAASQNMPQDGSVPYDGRQAIQQRGNAYMMTANVSGIKEGMRRVGQRPASCGGACGSRGGLGLPDRLPVSASGYIENIVRVVKVRDLPSLQNR